MVPEVIRTDRLVLRPFSSTDADDILAYASDPSWYRFSNVAQAQTGYTRADAVSFVARQLATDPNEKATWAIEYEGRASGSIKAHFFYGHRVAELGYGVAKRAWGRGLAVEACRAIITACYKEYSQLIRFRARSDARNTQSIRVMSKLGMSREAFLRSDRFVRGELVDEVIYGLLRREWITPLSTRA